MPECLTGGWQGRMVTAQRGPIRQKHEPARFRRPPMSDFATALLFWCVYELLSWPMRVALAPLPAPDDVRRVLSRAAGPALLALMMWLAGHGLIPLTPAAGWALAALAAAGAAAFVAATRGSWRRALASLSPVGLRTWKRDIALEAGSLALFMGYVAFRRLAPEMTFEIQSSGAEKFPNAMLFWSCWHATSLPPPDYWLAGQSQTYYTWGHYFWSWVGRLGGFHPSVVIALALGRTVLLTAEACYLLLRAFRLRWRAAALGALLIALGGNPKAWVTLGEQIESRRELIEASAEGGAARWIDEGRELVRDWNWMGYSFWEPSRAIEDTVTEFPVWSAILGDFHAHHLSLGWLMTWVTLLVAGDRWLGLRARRPGAALAWLGASLAVAGLGVAACLSNLWSLPLVLAALPWLFLWRGRRSRPAWGAAPILAFAGLLLLAFVLEGTQPLAPLGAGSSGGGGAAAPSLPLRLLPPEIRSTEAELLGLWGFQAALIVAAVALRPAFGRVSRRFALWLAAALALIGTKLLLSFGISPARHEPALYGLALACMVAALRQGPRPWLSRGSAYAGCAVCVLLAGLEYFYVQDRMEGALARYNSYFKFSYPVWPVLSAVAWIGAVRLWGRGRGWGRWPLRAALLALIPAASGMLVFGAPARVLQARYGDVSPRAPTLDAFAWLANRPGYAAEAGALAWIRENVPPGDVVAEAAVDEAYAYNGRVASVAGRPVPLGWPHHEAQWRGPAVYETLGRLEKSVSDLYRAPDAQAMREAAARLGVRWAILGRSERSAYGPFEFTRIREVMGRAAQLRAAFPPGAPEVFVFEFTP